MFEFPEGCSGFISHQGAVFWAPPFLLRDLVVFQEEIPLALSPHARVIGTLPVALLTCVSMREALKFPKQTAVSAPYLGPN